MVSKKALFCATLLTLTFPTVAAAQFSLDAATSPGDVSFSNNSILPLQKNYPPLDSAVSLGQDIYKSNSASPDTGAYNPTGIFQVDDINQAAKDSKPSFLKDLFSGPSESRSLHPTTKRVFDILGYAQRGLQTYKGVKGIYGAIKGKDPSGIVGGARNLLLLYGIVDPNSAALTAATLGSTQTLASAAGNLSPSSAKIQQSAFKNPKDPYSWYFKSLNNDALASMAAQAGSDIVLSEDGQKRLQAEEEVVIASGEALQVVIQDAAKSAVQTRQLEATGQGQAKQSIEVAGKTQKRKSTQQAVKDLSTMASIQANIAAIQNSTLAEINDNSLRQLGASASIVGMQRVIADKTTTMQLMTALNGRQLANINSGVTRAHNYTVGKDRKTRRGRQRAMQGFVIPVAPKPSAPTTTTAQNGGTP